MPIAICTIQIHPSPRVSLQAGSLARVPRLRGGSLGLRQRLRPHAFPGARLRLPGRSRLPPHLQAAGAGALRRRPGGPLFARLLGLLGLCTPAVVRPGLGGALEPAGLRAFFDCRTNLLVGHGRPAPPSAACPPRPSTPSASHRAAHVRRLCEATGKMAAACSRVVRRAFPAPQPKPDRVHSDLERPVPHAGHRLPRSAHFAAPYVACPPPLLPLPRRHREAQAAGPTKADLGVSNCGIDCAAAIGQRPEEHGLAFRRSVGCSFWRPPGRGRRAWERAG